MNVLSVREYDRLEIDPVKSDQSITPAELTTLYQISNQANIRFFDQIGANEIRFCQFVGVVQMGSRLLEILPKIEPKSGELASSAVRLNLLSMLLTANDVGIKDAETARVGEKSETCWIDILILLFCRALAEQARKGLARRYRDEQDDLAIVRGRILLDEQLRRNMVHQERIAVEFDELDENHALNQVFKLALVRMLRVSASLVTQQSVRELLMVFEGVELRTYHRTWVDGVMLDRLTQRFGFCLRLARLFLRDASPDISGGRRDSFALLFDMNELFEKYIGKVMQREVRGGGMNLSLQDARYYLLKKDNVDLFQLRPDMVAFFGTQPVWIADTKWKRLDGTEAKLGVSQPDTYQMLAYASRYKCNHMLLLYPYHPTYGATELIQKCFSYQGHSIRLMVAQVSLSDLGSVGPQLKEISEQFSPNFS